MVTLDKIDESIEKSILKKELTDIIVKGVVEVVKCSTNSATENGEGAKIHMADDPDGVRVPNRLLQHKGFDEDGNDLGYIADIKYPSGFTIDYYGGKITFPDGTEFRQDFLDNYKTDSNGNVVHDKKGSAEEALDYQFKEADVRERRMLVKTGSVLKSGSVQNLMKDIHDAHGDESGSLYGDLARNVSNPKLRDAFEVYQYMFRHGNEPSMLLDRESMVTGTQISRRDMNMKDAIRINSSSEVPLSSSAGRLNDKTINVRSDVTDDVRSLNGEVNNWDNTWKIYTCVTQGDGTHAMYLGYPQNVKAGAWDNSGNMYNDVTYFPNQKFKRVLVDKSNGVIIQVPVNE